MSDYTQDEAKDVLDMYVKTQEKQISELNNRLIVLKTKNSYLEEQLRKEKAKGASDAFLKKMAVLKRHNKNLTEINEELKDKMEAIDAAVDKLPAHVKRILKDYEVSKFINIEEKKPVRRGGQLR
jgi:ATP-dependent Clp protease ATP-binding subunit ClpA